MTLGHGFEVYFDGRPVKDGDTITEDEADFYLQHEVRFKSS